MTQYITNIALFLQKMAVRTKQCLLHKQRLSIGNILKNKQRMNTVKGNRIYVTAYRCLLSSDKELEQHLDCSQTVLFTVHCARRGSSPPWFSGDTRWWKSNHNSNMLSKHTLTLYHKDREEINSFHWLYETDKALEDVYLTYWNQWSFSLILKLPI